MQWPNDKPHHILKLHYSLVQNSEVFLLLDFILIWTFSFLFQHGFKTFLGIIPQVAGWSSAGDEFSLVIENNPLAEFVELPEGHSNLWYSSILIGVIKGALQMVSIVSSKSKVTDSSPSTGLWVQLHGGVKTWARILP